MICFAVDLDQLGFKIGTYLLANHFHRGKMSLLKYVFSVFGDKDQMHMNIRYTVPSCSNIA